MAVSNKQCKFVMIKSGLERERGRGANRDGLKTRSPFQPDPLKQVHRWYSVTFLHSFVTSLLLHFFIGMTVNGFTNLYLLTLEKRFQLTSTDVGFVAASNDVAGILLTALVSFYGTYGNKIKWLGYGSVITGKGKGTSI